MRGRFLHNKILIEPLDAAFRSRGAATRLEAPVTRGRGTGYIDLLVELGTALIAIEAELTPHRVTRDLIKASGVNADELWIVVPTRNVAKAARRVLDGSPRTNGTLEVFVLTLGAALQRVRECFPLFFVPNVPRKTNPLIRGARPNANQPAEMTERA